MVAVADTSYIVAVTLSSEPDHQACLAVHDQQRIVLVPQSTLTEVAYLITRSLGSRATAEFLRLLPQSKYRLVDLTPEDIRRTSELLFQYADSRLDFVDATIVAVAERLKITQILTLDERDFRMIRP